MSKSVTQIGYSNYSKAFDAKVANLARRGVLSENAETKLTYYQWKITYANTRNQMLEEVKAGTRKVIGNINQHIISRQVYDESAKQARKILGASKVTGQKITISEIRAGKFDWTQVDDRYHELRGKGLKSHLANKLNAEYFFGSE